MSDEHEKEKSLNVPDISVAIVSERSVSLLSLHDDTGSIGSSFDLLADPDYEHHNNKHHHQKTGANLDQGKLGFNLPTNDTTKSGQLDSLSVDSYWIGDDEIEDIEREKQLDPVNPNYKNVYNKVINKQTQLVHTSTLDELTSDASSSTKSPPGEHLK